MTTWTTARHSPPAEASKPTEPAWSAVLLTLGISLVMVFLTRLPVARSTPMESDEFGFLDQIAAYWFPMHHTLFLTLARALGQLVADPYRGFIILDVIMSAAALVSVWWWLRALVRPMTAAAGTLALGVGPVFWGYGAVAGNYTAILAVGAFLLGVAYRSRTAPAAWQPFAAAVVLAFGAGYRQDIGTFWLPVFVVILWQHRWKRAFAAGLIFTALNLAWLLPMLSDVGGWSRYRAASSRFAYEAGYLNSVWNLGLVDAPLRYSVKLGMALVGTLGPCLLFVPRGLVRLKRIPQARVLGFLLVLSIIPALGSHLLVHFGVPGYAFHYVPALLALAVIGIGKAEAVERTGPSIASDHWPTLDGHAPGRLAAAAVILAGIFLFYPTDYNRPGFRGSFDLSFARHTRIGLRTAIPSRSPTHWRTANSRELAGTDKRSGSASGL